MQKKKGISLIVLVITIIVMIILAAAIILSLNNAGIIGNANKAVDESNMDTIKAEADLKYAEYILNKSVIGANPTVEAWLNQEIQHEGYVIRVINKETVVLKEDSLANAYLAGTIKKGDYVTYKAGTNTINVKEYTLDSSKNVIEGTTTISSSDSMNWRVLGINNNGELLLTLENTTSEKISLVGKEGYFYGEQILHDACSVFGKGQYATGARSIIREDIDKITNVDYSKLWSSIGGDDFSSFDILKGVKVTIGAEKNNYHYYNRSDVQITDKLYHLGNTIDEEPTNTTYTFENGISYIVDDNMDKKVITTSSNEYKMLFLNSTNNTELQYYIANKGIGIYIDDYLEDTGRGIEYNIQCVKKNGTKIWVMSTGLFGGTVDEYGPAYSAAKLNLKPVVSIDKNTGYTEAITKINNVATWDLK